MPTELSRLLDKPTVHDNDRKAEKTPWLLVGKRTILTEQAPLVGEVSANFYGERVSRGQRNGSSRPLNSVFQTGAERLKHILNLLRVMYHYIDHIDAITLCISWLRSIQIAPLAWSYLTASIILKFAWRGEGKFREDRCRRMSLRGPRDSASSTCRSRWSLHHDEASCSIRLRGQDAINHGFNNPGDVMGIHVPERYPWMEATWSPDSPYRSSATPARVSTRMNLEPASVTTETLNFNINRGLCQDGRRELPLHIGPTEWAPSLRT
jgi:hypothetical protein